MSFADVSCEDNNLKDDPSHVWGNFRKQHLLRSYEMSRLAWARPPMVCKVEPTGLRCVCKQLPFLNIQRHYQLPGSENFSDIHASAAASCIQSSVCGRRAPIEDQNSKVGPSHALGKGWWLWFLNVWVVGSCLSPACLSACLFRSSSYV